METVSITVAKATLSKLLARVEGGEEIVLTRNGVPVARLVPRDPPQPKPKRVFGAWRGIITVGPEFFEPMTEEELAEWE